MSEATLVRQLFKANGQPRLGVKAILVRDADGEVYGNLNPDPEGRVSFATAGIPSGLYHIEYYGDGIQKTEFWPEGHSLAGDVKSEDPVTPWEYNIEIISMEGVEPIVFSAPPVLNVSEGTTGEDAPDADINKSEDTMVILSFTSLVCSSGRIRKISVYRKLNSNTSYVLFKEFNFDASYPDVSPDLSSAIYKERLFLRDKPEYHDFQAVFLNENDDPATTLGVTVVAEDLNAEFNGVQDLAEYTEVKDLTCNNIAGGGAGQLPGFVAQISWTDPRSIPRSSWGSPVYKNSFGADLDPPLTWAQAQKIYDFVVYLFVSSTGNDADYPRPGLNGGEIETQGTWYFMGNYKDPNAAIRCPEGARVNLWVGFRTERSTPTTPDTPPPF